MVSRYAELLGELKDGAASIIAFEMFFDLPDIEGAGNDFALSETTAKTGMTIFSVWSSNANLFKIRPKDGIYKRRLSESIDIIAGSAKRNGHLNLFYNSDGVARRALIQVADTQDKERFL